MVITHEAAGASRRTSPSLSRRGRSLRSWRWMRLRVGARRAEAGRQRRELPGVGHVDIRVLIPVRILVRVHARSPERPLRGDYAGLRRIVTAKISLRLDTSARW